MNTIRAKPRFSACLAGFLAITPFATADDAAPIDAPDAPVAADTVAVDTEAAPPPPPRPMGELGPGVPPFVVRPGYRVTLASKPGLVRDARMLATGPRRSLFVAERAYGAVALLRDEDRDGVYDVAVTFVENRPGIHAVQFHRGWVYFSTPNRIERARDTDGDLLADDIETVVDGLPGEEGDARAMLITRNFLYTAIGDSGAGADELLSDRQKVWRYSLDGGGKTLHASGIGAVAELQARPGTSELWGIDAARERAAAQADELNRYDASGFFGHPFLDDRGLPHAGFAARPDLAELRGKALPPKWTFLPSLGATGIAFVTHRNPHFPPDHRGDLFVACRGKSDDGRDAGFRVERVLFDEWTGKPFGAQPIVITRGAREPATLATGPAVLARPVDLVETADGSLLFSSDAPEHAIYRLGWAAAEDPIEAATPAPAPEDPVE